MPAASRAAPSDDREGWALAKRFWHTMVLSKKKKEIFMLVFEHFSRRHSAYFDLWIYSKVKPKYGA
jgi:hypothetical protein